MPHAETEVQHSAFTTPTYPRDPLVRPCRCTSVLLSVAFWVMRRLFVVAVVALVAVLGLPLRMAMSEMATTTVVGAGRSVDVRCTVECPSMPPAGVCLAMCLAGVAILSTVACVRRSQPASRLLVASSLFLTQPTGSSLFRPPRVT